MKKFIKDNGKTKTATITLILLLIVSMPILIQTQSAKAVTAVPDRNTGAYLSLNPSLLGIKQELLVNLWVYPSPDGPHGEMGTVTSVGLGGRTITGLHYENITVTFTRPDGSKDIFVPMDGTALGLKAGQTEESGTMWFMYQPNQIGKWNVQFNFPGNTFVFANYSVYYKPSLSQVITFEVQQDNVSTGLPPVPLPTNYWSRPINADNREWYQISGNMLVTNNYGNFGSNFNPYTTAPNTAHILWKNSVSIGGLVGGEYGSLSYASTGSSGGASSNGAPSYICNGKVYINQPTINGTMMQCVDLRTGELVWQQLGSMSSLSLEYVSTASIFEFSASPAPYIWQYTATAWNRYDAYTGQLVWTLPTNASVSPTWLYQNLTGVFYSLQQGAWSSVTYRRPYVRLQMYNLSLPGSTLQAKQVWNIDILNTTTGLGPGEGARGAGINLFPKIGIILVDTLSDGVFYAYDINTGAFLWKYDIGFPAMRHLVGPDNTIISTNEADMTLHTYQLSYSGATELWNLQVGRYPWGCNYLNKGFAYGNMYIGTYDGNIYCIDWATHTIKWSYYIGNTTETPYGSWVPGVYQAVIADGKVYYGTNEHSPTQPTTRGQMLGAIDAFTGKSVWNLSSFAPEWAGAMTIADGCLINTNEADGFMYCFGKGQTETTVTAPSTDVTLGQSLIIQGTVMDLSPAQKGTAAISDQDMTEWMSYLHMQNATAINNPPDPKGVAVSLDTIDPNGNYVHIGNTTSDMEGNFGLSYTPNVPGTYRIIASFAGSDSYWASKDSTYIAVTDSAASSTPIAEQAPTDFTTIYVALVAGVIAIIAAIAIATILMLRKKA